MVSLTQLPSGVQPPIVLDEFFEAEEAVRRDPRFLAALKRRGIANVDLVMVDPWSAGLYGNEPPEHEDRRLVRALSFIRSEERDNGYARPLDSVLVMVDINTMEVLEVEDHGAGAMQTC